MNDTFIHLNLHSQYSIIDSTIRIPELMKECVSNNFPAITLTDQNNVFGMVKFYRKALEHGIKPIIGCDVFIADSDDTTKHDHLILLCANNEGYQNLTQLITKSWLKGQTRHGPRIHKSWLKSGNCKGLIALSAGTKGDVGRSLMNDHHDLASRILDSWLKVFDDRFYIELVRTNRQFEEDYIEQALFLANDFSVPVVATNDVRFISPDDFESHEARVCIHDGLILSDPKRPKNYSNQQYLKSASEINSLFADIPEAVSNTIEIAKRCNLNLDLGKSFLPVFPIPNKQTSEVFLFEEANKALEKLLTRMELKNKNHGSLVYKRRLQDELDVINNMGFASYFLIVSDFIDWAKKNNIPVGPGRGSGAGSLVAYVLGITNLDPMEYDLLFERFLNPERVSMPDFDIDFCMEGRDKVIDYVSQKYGSEKVSQIITYGTMAARAVIRDAGRVLDQPYGFVDKIAKQVPFEVGMTLDKALEQDDELRRMYSQDEEVEAIINLAKSLEGLVRNAGKHAGGVVIAPENLTDYTPLYCEEGQINVVTQFDKDDVEAAGLVKFDFLGLRTLTIIDLTMRIVNNSKRMKELNINEIPMDDAKTFELLRSCNTTAVFQLESTGMRDLIKRMKPDQFDDLIALVALFRPGPLQSGMVDDFINRKHDSNNLNINYLHPDLEVILKETYGVILYQEQVMQIAQILAGYSLGSADILRRAMGKKKIDEMATQRKIFINGSIERGVSKNTASYIFDLMEKFAGYGFNKSHSAAYALLSYQTAFLKAHFTPHFLAAVMTTEIDNTDRLIMIKDDCLKYNIELIRPSINSSFYEFTVLSENSILYGLGAIKGIGKSTVELIVSERSAKSYQDLNEFCSRLGMEKINRRVLEALIKSGAMDDFGISRKQLNSQLADAIKSADQGARDIAAGQNDMFGLNEISEEKVDKNTEIQEWEDDLFLKKEKEALGLYLSGHPFNAFKEDALYFTDGDLKTIHSFEPPNLRASEKRYHQPLKDIIVSGLIADIKRRGNRISVILDDNTTRMEAVFFSEVFQLHKELLKKDQIVVIEGKLRFDDFSSSWQVNVDKVINIEDMIVQRAKILIIELKNAQEDKSVLSKIKQTLKSSDKGQCLVAINYSSASASGRVDLGDEWMISPTKDVRENLVRLLGEGSLRLNY